MSILFIFLKYVDTTLCNIVAKEAINTDDRSQLNFRVTLITNIQLFSISSNLFADFSLGSSYWGSSSSCSQLLLKSQL